MKRKCMMWLAVGVALWLGTVAGAARAAVTLPPFFSDHMVLQHGVAAPIWGKASPGEKVTVSYAGKTATATADAQGAWRVKLGPLPSDAAEGPLTITSDRGATIEIKDVVAGDVWICSGQSNMQWTVKQSSDAEKEIARARDRGIRVFRVPMVTATQPTTNLKGGEWKVCSPETAGDFTAVGYFFARELRAAHSEHIGLIDNSWGGMPAESFMTREALASAANFKPILDRKDDAIAKGTVEAQAKHAAAMMEWDAKYGKAATQATTTKTKPATAATQPPPRPAPPANPHAPNHGSNIYNAMVHPLVGYAIKGAIWYQGESNAGRAEQYRTLFPAMIADWRKQWGQGDFPFLFVQLANFGGWKPRPERPADSAWAELREAQTMTLAASPNTAMAVIIDIGDSKDIHPRNKQDVGKRLALAAEKMVYGKTDVESSGPMYASHVVEGDKIRVKFAHADGLVARGGMPRSFAVADADKEFHWADAAIEGDEIVVSSKDVPRPVAVRYAWEDDPQVNLYNAAGLPMCPFRTDDWPLATAGAK